MLTRRDVPDALFATDNDFGIPRLDPDLQADYVHLPVLVWGSLKRNQVCRGTYCFYTDDYRFEALWSDPSGIVNSQCVAIVEPNFSISNQMVRAVSMHQIYRKRWLARFWQTHGIRTFVDLNVAPDRYYDNLLGVPRGWKAWMTRGYADGLHFLKHEYRIATDHAETEDILFAVYGGGRPVQELCTERAWIWIPETCDQRKGKFFVPAEVQAQMPDAKETYINRGIFQTLRDARDWK